MPALTSVTLAWPDGTAIRIESGKSKAAAEPLLLGALHDATVTGEPQPDVATEKRAHIAFESDQDLLFEPLRLMQEISYQFIITLPLSYPDAVEAKESKPNPAWPFVNSALGDYVQVLSPRLWKEQKEPAPQVLIGAVFNARGYSGIVDLTIYDPKHRLTVEIVTAKLEYETEFKQLVSEVAGHQIQLLYDIGSITGERLAAKSMDGPDLASSLFQLRRLMLSDELPAAIETILANPLESIDVEEHFGRAPGRRPRAELLSRRIPQMIFVPGGPLSALFDGYSPRQMPANIKRQSFDNAENRYVKSFITELQEILLLLEGACRLDGKWIQAEEVNRWRDVVSGWLDNQLWQDVGTLTAIPHNSQRLHKRVGYRDVLRTDLELREALNIPISDQRINRSDTALGDLKPVDTLYEYWCYFVIRAILFELYGPDVTEGQGLIIRSAGHLSMRLAANTDGYSAIYVKNLPPDVQLHLFFNRRFQPRAEHRWGNWSGSYSVSFDPDISIAIHTLTVTHWISFDSKYRLERALWEDAEQFGDRIERSRAQAFKQEDLNKMHCYRDAILGTRGSFILYPGTDDGPSEHFVRRPREPRRGFGVPAIGAFPLRPQSMSQRDALKSFIKEIVDLLSSAALYSEETGLEGPRR